MVDVPVVLVVQVVDILVVSQRQIPFGQKFSENVRDSAVAVHRQGGRCNSENTQYITHISKLHQSTRSTIKNHSGLKTLAVASALVFAFALALLSTTSIGCDSLKSFAIHFLVAFRWTWVIASACCSYSQTVESSRADGLAVSLVFHGAPR